MRMAILNECEVCGARWAGEALGASRYEAAVAAAIIEHQAKAPRGCMLCNPDAWKKGGPYVLAEKQRQIGEGFFYLDGHRARFPGGPTK